MGNTGHGLFMAYSNAISRRYKLMKITGVVGVASILCFVLLFQNWGPTPSEEVLPIEDLKSDPDAASENVRWPSPAILSNVAIANRIVVAAVNCGYLDFVENWLASLQLLGITNYVLIALDQYAYDVLAQAYPDNTVKYPMIQTEPGQSSMANPDPNARNYGSEEFGNVVRSRPLLLLPFLQQGYTIFYSDIDTVWMKNPFDEIRQGEFDVQGASDSHPESPDDAIGDDNICTGMLYLEGTYPTIRLLEMWHHILVDKHADVNQASFSEALHQINRAAKNNHDVKIRYNIAERDAFPPGYMYFKNDDRWRNKDSYVPKREPVMVHANWVVGKKAKRQMLKDFDLWQPTGKLLPCVSDK